MGFFKEIYVKETKTGKLVNITDLDKEHYESFLECATKIKAAYTAALERRGDVPTRLSNCNIPLVSNRTFIVTIECGEDTNDWKITAPNELAAKLTASSNYNGKQHKILRCIEYGC